MKLRRNSLGLRVILFSSLWAVAAIALLGWLLIGLYRNDSERGFASLQEAQLFNLVGAVSVDDNGALSGSPNLGNTRFLEPESGWYWRVIPIEKIEGEALVSPSLAGADFSAPPLAELPFNRQFRRDFLTGGPGGEHQNTTDSAVRLTHLPSGIAVISRDERSQHRNKQAALRRLADRLYLQREVADARSKASENILHKRLERGNAVLCFKGEKFVES